MSNDDDELPEDEEEILVYVEFDGSIAESSINKKNSQPHMIGLDTEHPIMEVHGKFYEGTYEDAVGTYMFFEKDDNPIVDDPVFDEKPSLKYFGKTRKLLRMNRIFIEPRNDMLGDSMDPSCLPNMERIREAGIPPRYQESALKSWEKMREDRMRALGDYLEKQRLREEKRSRGIEPDSESDEDNPFSIYKPESKQKKHKDSEKSAKNTPEENGNSSDDQEEHMSEVNVPTIIDPGPSTSKNSQPWKSPPSDNQRFSSESDEDMPLIDRSKSKRGTTVQVPRKSKLRKHGKFSEKKPVKKTANRAGKPAENFDMDLEGGSEEAEETEDITECSENNFDDSMKLTDDSTEENEKDANTSNDTSEIMSSLSISRDPLQSPEQSKIRKKDECELALERRKLEKQQKREEKMRDIAGKLKKAADELRLKSSQTSKDVS